MARQSTTPVSFNKTTRKDSTVLMSSARAGVVVPCAYIPLLAGDSASGRVGIDVQLKEMPKPLLNAVHANVQAWFVPKSSFPQFAGRDELMHAMTGEPIHALGQPDRNPPPYFTTVGGTPQNTFWNSSFAKILGIHSGATGQTNTDLIDAFNLVYNFRLAAHSSRMTRRAYASESMADAVALPPAFWPSSRLSAVVPDYERALVVGSLDLDVIQGRLPLSGLGIDFDGAPASGPASSGSNTLWLNGNKAPLFRTAEPCLAGGHHAAIEEKDSVGMTGWVSDPSSASTRPLRSGGNRRPLPRPRPGLHRSCRTCAA